MSEYLWKMKMYFDKKRIGYKPVYTYVVGDRVWFNVKRRLVGLKKFLTQWVRPCEIIAVFNGGLTMSEYETGDSKIILKESILDSYSLFKGNQHNLKIALHV